ALGARLDEEGRAGATLRGSLAAQTEVLRVIGARRTLSASLAPKEGVAGSGRVLVDAASGESVIVVSGLAPAPEGRTYELWALRGDRPPEPAGLFAVGPEGSLARRSARVERPGGMPARVRGWAAATMTSSPGSWRRRTARSVSTASGSANCSPTRPATKRPPRTSPRASSVRSAPSSARHDETRDSRAVSSRVTTP